MGENTDNENKYNKIKMFIGDLEVFENLNIINEDEQIKYIKEHISKSLQIDNLNFLLGAGCSSYYKDDKEIGISTMVGLFDDFIQEIKKIKDGISTKYSSYDVNSFFFNDSFINDKNNDKFNKNLEELLEYLNSLSVVANKIDKQSISVDGNTINLSKIESGINLVKKFIIDKIIEAFNCKDTDVIELYKTFYQKIINNNRKRPINIFTTNYDVFNEQALDDLKFLYNNGFSGTVNRTFNQMVYNYMFVENMNLNKDIWEPVPYFFNLVKLHGSITWEADRDNFKIYENTNFKCYTTDNFFNKVMIYPSPLKDRDTLMTPYSDLFRFLENSLYLNNSTLIVIGYSFGDPHINRLIYNALANPYFKLIIFNDSIEVKKLIKQNDKRITVIYSEKDGDDESKKAENISVEDKTDENNGELFPSNYYEKLDKSSIEYTTGSDVSENESVQVKTNSNIDGDNKNKKQIHYFESIVSDILPYINDDLKEKDRIDKMLNNLNTIFKDNEK